eukprot:scaffold2987_cov77-Skeletonema_dohrnii-CCMP3373.AAC.5
MSSKRRKILTNDSSHKGGSGSDSGIIRLPDLPVEPLTHVASYLAPPSRALFDVALNFDAKPNSADSSSGSSAIAGNDWDALDFGDIEKDLAAKLTDDDISGVLVCIDAVNNLKKLSLTNCINITGVGLEPLRGSIIIEQIDLSLVGYHESPELDQEPPLSCTEVLPILVSIIERGFFALKHLHFPWSWRQDERNIEYPWESEFHNFLLQYNDALLHNRDVSCLRCDRNLPPDRIGWMVTSHGTPLAYGSQSFTCFLCHVENAKGYTASIAKKWKHARVVRKIAGDCGDFKQCYHCQEKICYSCVSEEDCQDSPANSVTCITCYGCRGRTFQEIKEELGDDNMSWKIRTRFILSGLGN